MALLLDVPRGRTGIEFYVPDNKEIGNKIKAAQKQIEGVLGYPGSCFEASKASGIRFYHDRRPVRNYEKAWDGYIREQLKWALDLRHIVDELGL